MILTPDYDLGTARGRIELDASSLGRASEAFIGLGRNMILMGGAAVGGFAYAVKSAADFEKIMGAVSAVTNASEADMARLSQQALDLGGNSVYSADQIGQAMEQLGKAGITVDEMLGGATEATIALAAAAGDELAGGVDQAAVVIANAMRTFGASAGELDHFADVIVGAAVSSTISVDDMATTLKYAGPIAAALGIDIDSLSTAIAILGDRGIRGSTAGTSLRGVLLSLTPTSKKAAETMRELGLITADGKNRFYDLNGSLKPLPAVMQILGDATKNLSQQEKVAAFNAIFQRRAMNSAMILAEQGAAGFDKYSEAIAGIDAEAVAEKKLDNLSGDLTLLKNSLDALIIKVGLPFQDMLRGWVEVIQTLVNKLHDLDPALLSKIVLIGAIAGSVLIALGAFSAFIGMAIKMYRNFKILGEAILLVTKFVKLMTLSFLTNPLFLFVAALAAIAAALYLAYTRSEEFRARVDAAISALQPIFQAVGRFVSEFVRQFIGLIEIFRDGDDVAQRVAETVDGMFGNTGNLIKPVRSFMIAMQDLWPWLVKVFDYFANEILPVMVDFGVVVGKVIGKVIGWLIRTGIPAIVKFASAIIDDIGGAVQWFGDNVAPVFGDVANLIIAVVERIIDIIEFLWPVFQLAGNVIEEVMGAIGRVVSTVLQTISIVWGNFGDNILGAITLVWNLIKVVVEGALRFIRGIIQVVTGIISGDWEKAWEGVKNIFGSIWDAMIAIPQLVLDAIVLIIESFFDLIITLWEGGWNLIKDGAALIWELIMSGIAASLQFIFDQIENVLGLVKGIWEAGWNSVSGFLGEVWSTMTSAISTAIGEVVEFHVKLPGRILEALGNLLELLVRKGKDLINGLWNGINDIWRNLRDFFANLPRTLKDFFVGAITWLYDVGKKIIQGLYNGMKAVWDNTVGGWLGSLGDLIPDIKGPPEKDAKLLVNNGELIMKGLFRGLSRGWADVSDLMSSMAPTIQSTLLPTQTVMAAATAAGGGAGAVTTNNSNTSVSVQFDFSNGSFGTESAMDIEQALWDSDVIGEISRSLTAKVGSK